MGLDLWDLFYNLIDILYKFILKIKPKLKLYITRKNFIDSDNYTQQNVR